MDVNSLARDMNKIENYLLKVKAAMLEAAEDAEDCLGEGCGEDEGEGDEEEGDGEDEEEADAEDEED